MIGPIVYKFFVTLLILCGSFFPLYAVMTELERATNKLVEGDSGGITVAKKVWLSAKKKQRFFEQQWVQFTSGIWGCLGFFVGISYLVD